MTRTFRGAIYRIHVTVPKHVEHGVKRLLVDGNEVDPTQLVPAAKVGTKLDIEVELGGVPSNFWIISITYR